MSASRIYQPLTLPATLEEVYNGAIQPAYTYLPGRLNSPEATCLLLAIGSQESGFNTRQQKKGPAHGLWQFEGNGVRTVLYSHASGNLLWQFCQDLGITYGSLSIYDSLLDDDILAAGLARLMLWSDSKPLPKVGDIESSWDYYKNCWNPGKPSRPRWSLSYSKAVDTIKDLK